MKTHNFNGLPPELQSQIAGKHLLVFDGVCVLCSWFFQFLLRHDRQQKFHFATAQSPLGQALFRALALPTDDFETNLMISDGQIFTKLHAAAAVMRVLGGWFTPLSWIRFIPDPIGQWCYHRIARNRYKLFGKTDTCMVPTLQVRDRFLPGGFS